ncbi:MAG TPA: hypothetical protein VFU69_16560 [Ktedonobacterales bacterium]|nr:hypothetical protein [Ktedonobacterales bacterium]
MTEEQEGGCCAWAGRPGLLYRSLAINAGVCYTGSAKMMKKPPVLHRLICLMPVSFPHLLLSANSVCLNDLVGLCYADGGINEGASLVGGGMM